MFSDGMVESFMRWAGLILLLITLLGGSMVARRLSHQYIVPLTVGQAAAEYLQRDVITESDIRSIDSRLQCRVNQPSSSFRITQIRVGNSLEGYRNAQSCFGESDFMMTKDGRIVSAHDDNVGGSCGIISKAVFEDLYGCHMADGSSVASLEDYLSLPMSEWFIDLKITYGADPKVAKRAVKETVATINRYGRNDGAVLMIYQVPDGIADYLRESNIRAGIKGYPSSESEARRMIDLAAESGFEMMCVNITLMSPELINYSESRGVWQMPWALNEYEFPYWQNMINWGAGGLITAYVNWANQYLEF
jgi:hypothetical protein